MAVTSTIAYCQNSDLFDIFPDFGKYNNRVKITGWELMATNLYDGSLDVYMANSTGSIIDLFFDRSKCAKIAYDNSAVTTTTTAVDQEATSIPVASVTNLSTGDIIKIGNEYGIITIIGGDAGKTLTVTRGHFGTTSADIADAAEVAVIYDTSEDTQDADASSNNPAFVYDSDLDKIIFISKEDPNDYDVHAGRDFQTYTTSIRQRASRMIESLLDHRMSREIMKDREGNYPTFIIRATALQAIILMIKANEPLSELIIPFQQELDFILHGLREGTITLPNQVTRDSSKGVLREVLVNSSSDLRPVELRGHYGGRDYELLKVKIESGEGGAIGTSKYTVYASDGDNLKTDVIIDSEPINGRFQELGVGSLEIRWGGDDVATAITTALDEYEIELHGYGRDATNSQMGSIRMTRRFQG